MPSCIVRLTLLLLPAALAAGLRALAVKDAVAAHQTGGDMGITRNGDLYCYGTEKEASEKGDNGSEEEDRLQFLNEEDHGNCDADKLCIENDYEAVSEDIEDSIEDLVTTLHCIGGTEQSACNSVYFACKDPKKCRVVCKQAADPSKEDHYACNSVHVCKGTKVVCKDKDNNTVKCDGSGIENGVDHAEDCWQKFECDKNGEALVFKKTVN